MTEIAVQVDDRIIKFLEVKAAEKQQSRAEALAELVDESYEAEIQQLYLRYLTGELTLRGIARHLGMSYRELYQEYENRELSF